MNENCDFIQTKKEKQDGYVIWTADTANMKKGQFYDVDILTGVIKKHETRQDIRDRLLKEEGFEPISEEEQKAKLMKHSRKIS